MTVKQVQHLLAYLGYYVGNVDGLWGTLSKTACKAFQKDFGGIAVDGSAGPETQKALKHAVAYGIAKQATTEDSTAAETTTTEDFWGEIKYFGKSEFACPCGKCNGFPAEPEETLVRAADKVREHFGAPMPVSSGVRCASHNKEVGGLSNSRHLSGKAMDFSIRGFSAVSVLPYVQSLPEIRYAYAIDSGWVHMDIQ